jgi:hypothetical protein
MKSVNIYETVHGGKFMYQYSKTQVDGNEPFLCWAVIQLIAALSLQIAWKVQTL